MKKDLRRVNVFVFDADAGLDCVELLRTSGFQLGKKPEICREHSHGEAIDGQFFFFGGL